MKFLLTACTNGVCWKPYSGRNEKIWQLLSNILHTFHIQVSSNNKCCKCISVTIL